MKINKAMRYILDLTGDFTFKDISKNTNFNASMIHSAKIELLEKKKIFHVGNLYSKSCSAHVYNRAYRPFESYPMGKPVTLGQQIALYILWIKIDFTMDDIALDLGLNVKLVYHAKNSLEKEGLIFHVGGFSLGRSNFKIYSNKYREFERIHRVKFKIDPSVEETKEKQVAYTPKDTLRGFVSPVDKTLDRSVCNG